MKTLAIETSSPTGSVAFAENGEIVFSEHWRRPKGRPRKGEKFLSHSEMVGLAIDRGLKKLNWNIQDVDEFVTSVGPGSFTGIRVGLATVRSFAFALDKPVFGYESLLVQATQGQKQDLPIVVLSNAYKNQIYAGLYQFENETLSTVWGPEVLHLEDLAKKLPGKCFCLGDGYATYASLFDDNVKEKLVLPEDDQFNFPQAEGLIFIHNMRQDKSHKRQWSDLYPLYLRASEAEEKLQAGLLKPVEEL